MAWLVSRACTTHMLASTYSHYGFAVGMYGDAEDGLPARSHRRSFFSHTNLLCGSGDSLDFLYGHHDDMGLSAHQTADHMARMDRIAYGYSYTCGINGRIALYGVVGNNLDGEYTCIDMARMGYFGRDIHRITYMHTIAHTPSVVG